MITESTSRALGKELTMSEEDLNSKILNLDWYFDVTFEEGKVNLFFERNKEKYDCRFAPRGQKVCYLVRDPIEREKEVGHPKRTKRVYIINKDLRIIDLNLKGESAKIGSIKEIFKDIEKLLEGERTEENYEASCRFAKCIIDAGFDGIYYSAHPDSKHPSPTEKLLLKEYKFDTKDALGPKERLVIFENNKKAISFDPNKYVAEVID